MVTSKAPMFHNGKWGGAHFLAMVTVYHVHDKLYSPALEVQDLLAEEQT